MQDNRGFFSLIVPTMNRHRELKRLIESLRDQTYQNFEVIIIDQNSSEDLIDISPFSNEKLFDRLKCFRPSFRLNASAARNYGVQFAKGGIITFPDDDCWYAPNILKDVLSIFEKEKSEIVCGCSLDPSILRSNSNFLKKSKFLNSSFEIPKAGLEYTLFCEKVIFIKLRGFDEGISPGSSDIYQAGEAMDFLFRAYFLRSRIFFCKNIRILHPYFNYRLHLLEEHLIRQRIFNYAAGFGYVLRKNRHPLIFVYYLIRSFGAVILSVIKFEKALIIYNWQLFNGRFTGFSRN